jgi:NAD(P)-dependent dehydrogenase (short-subunit alcohol dehydrogenase family)
MSVRMSGTLEGLQVVVTGAAGGLGPSVVEALRAGGAVCHTPTRQELNLTDEAAVTKYYASLPPLWASIQVAGGFAMSPLLETSLEAFQAQWQINAVTAFLSCREAARSIKRGGRGGRIVNVASSSALEALGGRIGYVASKSALAGMTRAMAAELKAERIFVNAVVPVTIDTPANRAAMPGADFSKWTPPADIAKAIAWLAGPGNTTVTGALVPV